MAEEPDDIEPDLLRERLLVLAEHGEITGKQADAAAAAHGLEPFERKPELPDFDPRLKSHWSIMMVVAWIAWRDFELVRQQDPEFCSACFRWVHRRWEEYPDKTAKAVQRDGYFLEMRPAPTVDRLHSRLNFYVGKPIWLQPWTSGKRCSCSGKRCRTGAL